MQFPAVAFSNNGPAALLGRSNRHRPGNSIKPFFTGVGTSWTRALWRLARFPGPALAKHPDPGLIREAGYAPMKCLAGTSVRRNKDL